MPPFLRGADLSTIQRTVDFVALKAAGTDFTYLRCGVGNDGADAQWDPRRDACEAASLPCGAYHFLYPLPSKTPGDSRDPGVQAKAHFDACGGYGSLAGQMPPVVDLEWPVYNDWGKWGVTRESMRAHCKAYLTAAEALYGGTPLVYGSTAFLDFVLGPDPFFARFPLWLASYPRGDAFPLPGAAFPGIPKPWTKFAIWQCSGGKARLPDGEPVDSDVIEDPFLLAALLSRPLAMTLSS